MLYRATTFIGVGAVLFGALAVTIGLVDGYRPVVITTGSMGTAAPVDSLVIAAPRSPDTVQVGDVLVMRRDGKATVTHRVIEVERHGDALIAITKGDANPSPDPTPFPLEGTQLVGRWVIPQAGGLLLSVSAPLIVLALILISIVVIAIGGLRRIWFPSGPDHELEPRGTEQPLSETVDDLRDTLTLHPRRKLLGRIGSATVALFLVTGGVGWALYTDSPAVPANAFATSSCFDAQVSSVQHGQTVSSVNGLQTIGITAVDPVRSVLHITVRSDANEPADSQVMARLVAGTSIELTRNTDSGAPPAITVEWSVIEYSCGVTVQRGTTAGSGTNIVDVTITSSPTAASYVLLTSVDTAAATDHDGNDLHIAELTSDTNLRIRSGPGSVLGVGQAFSWQVVTFDDPADASVQHLTTTLGPGTTSVDLTVPLAVDPATTFLLTGLATDASGPDIGERLVRTHLVDATTVQVTRLVDGDDVEVHVQVVELRDGSTVQHGTVDFTAAQPAKTVTLDAVDPTRATALSTVQLPGSVSGGATDMVGDDVIGEASVTTVISDPTTLTLLRDATTSAASFGWQVIEWGGPSWWDPDYPFRQRIDISTTAAASPDGYTTSLTFDHAAMVTNGLSLADGSDLRVVRWDGAAWTELDRVLDEASSWNQTTTTAWFQTQDPIPASSVISYWLYFGDLTPLAPLADPENVWSLYEDFESGTLGDFEDRTGGTAWYRALPWTRRIALTTDPAQVDAALTNFPLLVELTSGDLASFAQTDGSDIRFTAGDGVTPLPHEIETWISATGALTAWVLVPSVSDSAATTVYLYYGAADAPDQQDHRFLWAGDYEAVWHLGDNPAGAAPQIDDSSATNHDGVSVGAMNGGDLVDALIGKGLDLDGSDDRLDVDPVSPLGVPGLTLSGWVQATSFVGDPSLISQGSGASAVLDLRLVETAPTTAAVQATVVLDSGTVVASGGTVNTAAWAHVAATWDGTSLEIFVDGVSVGSTTSSGALRVDGQAATSVGGRPDGTGWANGVIDEIRVENVARSIDWLAASKRNQQAGSTLVVAGAPQAGTWFDQGEWTYRKPVRVDGAQVTGLSTNHPILVQVTDADLQASARGDGNDIVFTDSGGTVRLDHHVETWNAATGALSTWVRVPTLTSGTDSQLFIYYGNPSAVDQTDRAAVFGSDADAIATAEAP